MSSNFTTQPTVRMMNSWGCVTKTTRTAFATGTPAISPSCPDIFRTTIPNHTNCRTPVESQDRQLSISCTVGSWGSSAGLIIKARHLVGFNLCQSKIFLHENLKWIKIVLVLCVTRFIFDYVTSYLVLIKILNVVYAYCLVGLSRAEYSGSFPRCIHCALPHHPFALPLQVSPSQSLRSALKILW